MIAAGWVATRSATFAVSRLEPPPTPTKPSKFAVDGEVGRLLQRLRRRLDADAVEDDGLDARRLDRLHHALGDPGADDAGIADDHHPRGAEALELPARVRGRARPELDRRRLEGEDRLVRHCDPASGSRSSAGLRTKRSVRGARLGIGLPDVRPERLACEVRRDDRDHAHAHHVERDEVRIVAAGREQRHRDQRGEAAAEHARAGSRPTRRCSACASRTARRSTPPAARTSGRGRR